MVYDMTSYREIGNEMAAVRVGSIAEMMVVVGLVLTCLYPCGVTATPLTVGDTLPDFTLPPPVDQAERRYLGLIFPNRSFRLTEVTAEVIIIQCFSLYCPASQWAAPEMARLYRLIEDHSKLKGRIKLIGIGVGDSAFEVATFKRKYRLPFPLFPDPQARLYHLLGEGPTPYFLGIRLYPGGTHQVFLSQSGVITGAQEFLADVINRSGIP